MVGGLVGGRWPGQWYVVGFPFGRCRWFLWSVLAVVGGRWLMVDGLWLVAGRRAVVLYYAPGIMKVSVKFACFTAA